jgi:hypothetical protein
VKDTNQDWQPEYDKNYFTIDSFATSENAPTKVQALLAILDLASDSEQPALQEAIDCATNGYLRASIVLGWASAIYRMHTIVEKIGFEQFNKISIEMTNTKHGRFKNYCSTFHVRNFSDLQATVSDSALLWVLEYCELIDFAQHERLDACFTIRNTSAHPNSTKITFANVSSFFSDLKTLVFENPRLKL